MERAARSSLAGKAALVLASTAAGLLFVEVVLRVFFPQPLLEVHRVVGGDSGFTVPDAELGWRNRPGARGVTEAAGRSVSVVVNSAGFRDREHAVASPPGVTRVVVLGDSFVFGSGVDADDVVTRVLESKLGPGFEVLNLGVPGYGTDQEWLNLSRSGLRYGPRVVVLAFYVNDLVENTSRVIYGMSKPRFALEGGRLVLVDRPSAEVDATSASSGRNSGLVRWLERHSHTWVLLTRGADALSFARSSGGEVAAPERPLFVDFALERAPEGRRAEFDLTLALLSAVKATADEAGARFVLVAIPPRTYVDPALTKRLLALYGLPDGAFGDDPFRLLRAFAEKERVTFVDLVPAFRGAVERNERVYGPDNVHWNAAGHRLAAAEVARALLTP